MPQGRHIYAKASDMANATMCAYPHYDIALNTLEMRITVLCRLSMCHSS